MTTDDKKRKKLRITEGTGGDHAASIASGGPVLGENDIGFTFSEYVGPNTSTLCPVCKKWYAGNSYYGHSCIK